MKWKLKNGSKVKLQLGRLSGTQDSGQVLQYSMLIGFHALGRWHYAVVILVWREDGGEIPVGLNQRRGAFALVRLTCSLPPSTQTAGQAVLPGRLCCAVLS